jgi:hypothetical protein
MKMPRTTNSATKANGTIPCSQVPMMVHGKGRDPVAFLQAETGKGLG